MIEDQIIHGEYFLFGMVASLGMICFLFLEIRLLKTKHGVLDDPIYNFSTFLEENFIVLLVSSLIGLVGGIPLFLISMLFIFYPLIASLSILVICALIGLKYMLYKIYIAGGKKSEKI